MPFAPPLAEPSYHDLQPDRRELVFSLANQLAAKGDLEESRDPQHRTDYRPAGDKDSFPAALRAHGFVLYPSDQAWRICEEKIREIYSERADRADLKARRLSRLIKTHRDAYPACVIAGLEVAATSHRRDARKARAKLAATYATTLAKAIEMETADV